MVRDFTEKKKEALKKEIDSINKSTWSGFTDGVGDFFLRAGKVAGIINLHENMKNVESYQRMVLDMNDTTKKELDEIFKNVYALDSKYRKYFENIYLRLDMYCQKVKILSDKIHPNFSIESAAEIRKSVKKVNSELTLIDKKLDAEYKAALDMAEKKLAMKAVKGLTGGLISTVVDIICLPANLTKNIVTGNFLGCISDGWGIINDVFSVGSNLFASVTIGFSLLGGTAGFLNSTVRGSIVRYSEGYAGAGGLADALEADEKANGKNTVTTWMKKGARVLDTADAGYNLVESGKKIIENPKKVFPNDLAGGGEHKTLKKSKMLDKYKDKAEFFQRRYNQYEKYAITAKKGKRVYDYMDAAYEASNGEASEQQQMFNANLLVETSGGGKFASSISDFVEEGKDTLEEFKLH